MTTSNKAIYIDANNVLSVRDMPTYRPGKNQALLQVHYSGINPADLKHGTEFGMNDSVSGYEFNGTILEAGSDFPYNEGDDVYGTKMMGLGSEFSAHQDLMLVEGNSLLAKRPSTLPSADSATMSLVVRTAADALFNIMQIPFETLGFPGKGPTQRAILIWGGASGVGSAAIQLARAAGLDPIITTASRSHHKALMSLGATHCFDYSDSNAIADIQAVLNATHQPLQYIFDTVCTEGELSSWKHCEALETAPTACYVGSLPVEGLKCKWEWCVAARGWELHLPPPIGFRPADHEQEARLVKVTDWAAREYGVAIHVPNMSVIEGVHAALEAVQMSGKGQVRFKKFVIKHPLIAYNPRRTLVHTPSYTVGMLVLGVAQVLIATQGGHSWLELALKRDTVTRKQYRKP
ncbi:toxD [Fusarium phyllophilum]|uniref:ToxD n=1 Tax=Fusarium phyllophilum TaxID=47803 RepID=A0A8H5JG59_9HYPO|nr:toxD [Fusarium phyllophilum]